MAQHPKLKWQHLKDGKCPQCSAYLTQLTGSFFLTCTNAPRCPFKIGEDKAKEIIENKNHIGIRDHTPTEEENLQALSEL